MHIYSRRTLKLLQHRQPGYLSDLAKKLPRCMNKALRCLGTANNKPYRSIPSSVPDFDHFGILQISLPF